MTPKKQIQAMLTALVAELPHSLPRTADRRSMWDRIASVLKASANSEETFGKFLEAVTQRLQIDLALFLARPETANSVSVGNDWDEWSLREGLRQASEETALIVALARLKWEQMKEARALAAPPEEK